MNGTTDWNQITRWTDELVEQYLDDHPRNDGNRSLAKEILETDIATDENATRVRDGSCTK